MNKFEFTGRVGGDVKFSVTKDGKSVASFSVAMRRRFDSENVDWIKCTMFGDICEKFIKPFINKGDLVGGVGEIRIERFVDKNQINHSYIVAYLSEIELLSKKNDTLPQAESSDIANGDNTASATIENEKVEIKEEDLPF